jgi:flavin-dependent dehydrogenase
VRARSVPERFDVIVVGARCSGASLAHRLADAGCSVALLDAANLPSDQKMSTHLIQPPGMDELGELGVGDAVRALSPALREAHLSFDGHDVLLPYRRDRAAHCLRRQTLDRLLQEAAVSAGAELRPHSRAVAVTRADDGRVCGIELVERSGGRRRLASQLVVGADGRHSTVAKLVAAAEYLEYDGPRSCYWAYWRRPASWDEHRLANLFRGDDAFVVFPTDEDLLLIASAPPLERATGWRSRHTEAYMESVRSHPALREHLGGDRPVSTVRGMLRTRYFFRAAAGPGWALIGDAGHHKDFFAGLGISDALRDGGELARAILEAPQRELQSLESWWRRRDLQRIELFHWARELGSPEPVDALRRLTAARLAGAPELRSRFAEIIDGTRSPYEFIPTSRALRWTGAALLAGDARPLKPMLGAARRRAHARRDHRKMKRALRLDQTLRARCGDLAPRPSIADRTPAAIDRST